MNTAVRVMAFLDGSNLFWGRKYFCTQNNTNLKIDYKKMVDHVVAGRQLVRATYYCSKPIPPVNASQIKFFDYLRASGIQVVEKELKTRIDANTGQTRTVEKGVDVALAIDPNPGKGSTMDFIVLGAFLQTSTVEIHNHHPEQAERGRR